MPRPRRTERTQGSHSTHQPPQARNRPGHPARRTKRDGTDDDAVALAALGAPSLALGNTCTTHNQMLFWVDLFARMHRPSRGYVPYELKTLDCPVVNSDGSPRLRSDGQPVLMRCVREIACRSVGNRVEWIVFSWNIGQVGIVMPSFPTMGEAMKHYNAPPSAVLLP